MKGSAYPDRNPAVRHASLLDHVQVSWLDITLFNVQEALASSSTVA